MAAPGRRRDEARTSHGSSKPRRVPRTSERIRLRCVPGPRFRRTVGPHGANHDPRAVERDDLLHRARRAHRGSLARQRLRGLGAPTDRGGRAAAATAARARVPVGPRAARAGPAPDARAGLRGVRAAAARGVGLGEHVHRGAVLAAGDDRDPPAHVLGRVRRARGQQRSYAVPVPAGPEGLGPSPHRTPHVDLVRGPDPRRGPPDPLGPGVHPLAVPPRPSVGERRRPQLSRRRRAARARLPPPRRRHRALGRRPPRPSRARALSHAGRYRPRARRRADRQRDRDARGPDGRAARDGGDRRHRAGAGSSDHGSTRARASATARSSTRWPRRSRTEPRRAGSRRCGAG